MKNAKIALGVCALALGLALPGTAQETESSANRVVQPQARAQTRIESQVRHELVMLPYYGIFDNLEFRVDGDTVTLLGQVTQPTLKQDAENAAKSVEGVNKVDNQIKVLPASPADDRIRLAEYRAIYSEPSLQKYAMQAVPPIHIIVENGHVTLVGAVLNENDKNLAGVRANGVSGVFSVENNLRVDQRQQKKNQ